MEELLKHLTEVSIRQQQIMEHMASRQSETERELTTLRVTAAQAAEFTRLALVGHRQGHRPGAVPVKQPSRHPSGDTD